MFGFLVIRANLFCGGFLGINLVNQCFRLFNEDNKSFFFIVELPGKFIQPLLIFLNDMEELIGKIMRVRHKLLKFMNNRLIDNRRIFDDTLA